MYFTTSTRLVDLEEDALMIASVGSSGDERPADRIYHVRL